MAKFTRKPMVPADPAVEDFIAAAGRDPAPTADGNTPSNTIPKKPTTYGYAPMNIRPSTPAQPAADAPEFPWMQSWVRDDVTKVYNVRLPEAYLMKLRYIAGNTPGSMQRFCIDVLLPAIDAEIDRLTGGRG